MGIKQPLSKKRSASEKTFITLYYQGKENASNGSLLKPVRIADFDQVKMRSKDTLIHYWWGYKLVLPLWKMVWRFLKKN